MSTYKRDELFFRGWYFEVSQRIRTYRKEAYMVKNNPEEYSASSNGYDHLQVNLKTRVAIWMILQGLSAHLKDPLNWTLSYTTFTQDNSC